MALDQTSETGAGITVDLSSSGVLFQTARHLPKGAPIELSIAWPARTGESFAMNFHVVGRVVRSGSGLTAVAFHRHEFRAGDGRPSARATSVGEPSKIHR